MPAGRGGQTASRRAVEGARSLDAEPYAAAMRLSKVLLTLLLAAMPALLDAGPSAAQSEPPASAPIEAIDAFDPDIARGKREDVCRENRPGTVALRKLLDQKFNPRQVHGDRCREKVNDSCPGRYRPPRSNCWSNHANGRAIDVMVSVGRAKGAERAKGDRIVNWLLAKDSAGNLRARARRLGVQEILWFGRCWNARRRSDRNVTSVGQMRSGCIKYHDDHPHLSLTHAGADKKTSWWRSGGAAPGPGDAEPQPAAEIPPSGSGGGAVDPLLEPLAPTIAAWDANRVDVFQRVADGTVRQKYNVSGSGWSAWAPQGGRNDSSPDAGSSRPGRIDVFARGTRAGAPAAQLMQRYYDGGRWSDWTVVGGGALGSAPSVVARSEQSRLDVFYRAPDGALTQRYRVAGGAWSPPLEIGPKIASAPDATFQGGTRYDVFYRTEDGRLGQSYFNGTRWVHVVIGGAVASAPAAVSSQPGSLDVFAITASGELHQWYHRTGQKAWLTQKRLDGAREGADAASRGPGRIDLVSVDSRGRVVHNAFNGKWIGWRPI